MRATIHSLLKVSHEKRSNLFRILLLMDEYLERRFLTWLRLEMPSKKYQHLIKMARNIAKWLMLGHERMFFINFAEEPPSCESVSNRERVKTQQANVTTERNAAGFLPVCEVQGYPPATIESLMKTIGGMTVLVKAFCPSVPLLSSCSRPRAALAFLLPHRLCSHCQLQTCS